MVQEVVNMWNSLLSDTECDDQKEQLKRSNGMKIEQLKVEAEAMYQKLIDH